MTGIGKTSEEEQWANLNNKLKQHCEYPLRLKAGTENVNLDEF